MPLLARRRDLTVITGINPGIRYHYLQVIHVPPVRLMPQGPIGRWPVVFAGKRPEILKQALG